MNKKVFRNLSYGVYVVSTLDGTRTYRLYGQQRHADHIRAGFHCHQHQP